jgi:type IV secretion system protein VirB8
MPKLNKEPDSMRAQISALNEFIGAHNDMQTLLDNSAAWADGRTLAEQTSRRNAWRVACGLGGLTLIAFIVAGSAIRTSMQPAPPPQILVVDRMSGKVEPLISLAAFQAAPEDVTIRRCVATFMRARENYSLDTAEENYRDAAAFMDAPLQGQWGAYWDTSNPKSPMNTYKKDGKVHIEIGAITINRSAAGVATSVRASFTRTVKRNDQLVGPVTSWIATIPFHWVNAPTSERDRRVNDLGWEVTGYDVDADIGATAGAPSAPAAPAPQKPAVPALALTAPQIDGGAR